VGASDLTSGIGRTTAFVEWNTYPEGTRNENFLAQLAEAGVTAEAPVVFLCRSGARSLAAAEAATAAGFGPAYNVLDGFEGATNTDGHRGDTGWRAEGLPWKQSCATRGRSRPCPRASAPTLWPSAVVSSAPRSRRPPSRSPSPRATSTSTPPTP